MPCHQTTSTTFLSPFFSTLTMSHYTSREAISSRRRRALALSPFFMYPSINTLYTDKQQIVYTRKHGKGSVGDHPTRGVTNLVGKV
ncbi:hypothetical protein AAZX31_15G230400 [Glycine max]